MTKELAKVVKQVIAYEIDNKLVKILEEELKDHKNIKIIHQDFLKAKISDDINSINEFKRIMVISNLPYYITTPIILKLLEENYISEFYLMMQKEVGERLTSLPGRKEYGSLSVLMEYKTESKVVFTVSRNCFFPKPEIESVVVKIRKKEPSIKVKKENEFLNFIRIIFQQRRKTLVNNITSYYQTSKENLRNLLVSLGFKENVRSEDLDLNDIHKVYIGLFESPN